MEGCPHCLIMKNKLNENKIEFIERDIDEHKSEYDMFVEATDNEYVPAFMVIKNYQSDSPSTQLFAPDRDFEEINEAVEIIKYLLN